MANVEIKGLAELHKALQELPVKIERNVLRGGLRAGAKVMEEEAKRLAPVSPPSSGGKKYGAVAGELRDSIRVSMRTSRGTVRATVKAGNKKAWYANFVEFGTARHWISAQIRPQRWNRRGDLKTMAINTMNKKAKRGEMMIGSKFVGEQVIHPGARPKPFMRPAFDGKWRAAIDAMADYIRTRLPKELGKARK
jgi:HK97 gp10 family phage protein